MEEIKNENQEEKKLEQEELKKIKKFIEEYRQLVNISPEQLQSDIQWEGSCFGYRGGEIAHLIERQLLYTHYDSGAWHTLKGIDSHSINIRRQVINQLQIMINQVKSSENI